MDDDHRKQPTQVRFRHQEDQADEVVMRSDPRDDIVMMAVVVEE